MKKARYFCEHCGAEVARAARVCPSCGRFFSSVKCPKCGYSGDPERFKRGCPVCGYSSSTLPVAETKKTAAPSGPLPLWVYILALGALTAALSVFFAYLR